MTVLKPRDVWNVLSLALMRLSGKPVGDKTSLYIGHCENFQRTAHQDHGGLLLTIYLFLHELVGEYSASNSPLGIIQSVF